MRSAVAMAAIGGAVVTATTAGAVSLTAYSDFASWQAAAGASIVEDFQSSAVGEFSAGASGDFSVTGFNGFDISGDMRTRGSVGIDDGSGSTIFGSQYLYWSRDDQGFGERIFPRFTFAFTTPVTAFAFDWADEDNTIGYDLVIDGLVLTPSLISGPGTGDGFLGVVATSGVIHTATIQPVGGSTDAGFSGLGIDNVRTSVVPTPAAALPGLVMLGWLGAARLRRRKAG